MNFKLNSRKFKNTKHGWYKLQHPEKFIKPIDEYMGSYEKGCIEYKSSLEFRFIKYCDYNKNISKFSLEPFSIPYTKPTDGKTHRYYIDFFIEYISGDKFLVEIKPLSQLSKPRLPHKKTYNNLLRYKEDLETYYINQAKWKAAKEFADSRGMRFVILTEKELRIN